MGIGIQLGDHLISVMAFSYDLVVLTEDSCHMLAAIKECQRFLDQKGLKSNVEKCGILKVLPVKGKRSMKVINLVTSMMVWTSIRLYHTAKVSWCLHSVWREDCCTTCNMAGKTGIFNILLLDTYTKVIYTLVIKQTQLRANHYDKWVLSIHQQ